MIVSRFLTLVIAMGFKATRIAAGFTQEMAATALGIRRSTVAMWESGRSLPRADKLQALARLYGCTVEDLLKDKKA